MYAYFEPAYFVCDRKGNFQYRAFTFYEIKFEGVPALHLQLKNKVARNKHLLSRGRVGRVAIISSGVGLLHSNTSISEKGTPEPRTLRFFNHWSYFIWEKFCSCVAVKSNLQCYIRYDDM